MSQPAISFLSPKGWRLFQGGIHFTRSSPGCYTINMSKLKAAQLGLRMLPVKLSRLGRGWDPFRGMIWMKNVTVIVWLAGSSSSGTPRKVRWLIWAGPRLLATAASPVSAPMTRSSPSLYKLTAQSFSITTLPMDPGEVTVWSFFCNFIKWQQLWLTVKYFCFCRLEMLQQIANRVQRDCVNGEDKLALARTALQSVSFVQSLIDLM